MQAFVVLFLITRVFIAKATPVDNGVEGQQSWKLPYYSVRQATASVHTHRLEMATRVISRRAISGLDIKCKNPEICMCSNGSKVKHWLIYLLNFLCHQLFYEHNILSAQVLPFPSHAYVYTLGHPPYISQVLVG